jgi:hypothetical protein
MNVADMIPADSPVWKQGDSALFVANYTLHQAVNLPGGLKEISVSAANYSKGEMTKEYDPASHLVITVDNQVIGDTYLKRPDFMKFAFQFYGSEGWRMLGISFDNDEYVPERGQDRNVLVKDVEISQLVGSVFVNIRKKLRDRYRPESYTLSYFRSLPEEERNDLTRFYKSRFLVESLKDVIAKNYSVWALIKHVEIGGLTKEAIFAPSPTKLRWRLKVPMGGMRLSFGYGIMEEAWRRPGDGVEFRVRLDTKPEEPEIVLFSRYINPKSSEKDRQWFTAVVDVTRYSGKEITLLFETAGSPARQITPVLDTAYDYAVWSS